MDELRRPQKVVVNSFFARDCVLTTPLAIWYLNHGLRISNITQAFEWKPKAMYERFAETVAEERRKADANFALAIKGDLFKLAGNSIYGTVALICLVESLFAVFVAPRSCDQGAFQKKARNCPLPCGYSGNIT